MDEASLPEVLIRYGPPHKMDKAPYLTKCKVIISTVASCYDMYIQMSKDSEQPRWELVETNLSS